MYRDVGLAEKAQSFKAKKDLSIEGLIRTAQNYSAHYPNGVNLRPDSEAHGELLTTMFNYGMLFRNKMSEKYRTWRLLDEALSSFIQWSEEEKQLKEEDSRTPVSMVLPYLAMQLEIWLTYWVEAFLERPYIPLTPISPEDVVGTLLLEKVIDQQCLRDKSGLQLYVAFKDMFTYGLGGVHLTFERNPRLREAVLTNDAGDRTRRKKRDNVQEGNVVRAIDPYQLILDPNVAFVDYQRGEYVGWVERTNRQAILSLDGPGSDASYFNGDYLSALTSGGNGGSVLFNTDATSGGRTRYEYTSTLPDSIMGVGDRNLNTLDIQHMYMNIIPAEWGFSKRKKPQHWYFAVAGDRIIVAARPLSYDHEHYPVILGSPDLDGHTTVQVSKVETHYPVQERVNWLLNSRMANVRKCLDGVTIYDPMYISPDKMAARAEGGKQIAVNEEGWGRDVRTMLHNVDVPDVTAGHLGDVSMLLSLMDNTGGSTPSIRGELQLGERVTRYQAQSARSSSLRRIERGAKIMALMFRTELGEQMIFNTQQWMTVPMWVKIVGTDEVRLIAQLKGRQMPSENMQMFRVEPVDIMVGTDVTVSEGSMLGLENIAELMQALQIALSSPELSQRYDISRLFGYIMFRSGVRNISDFERSVAPNEAGQVEVGQVLGGQGNATQQLPAPPVS